MGKVNRVIAASYILPKPLHAVRIRTVVRHRVLEDNAEHQARCQASSECSCSTDGGDK